MHFMLGIMCFSALCTTCLLAGEIEWIVGLIYFAGKKQNI
jgi:hypothetical protein